MAALLIQNNADNLLYHGFAQHLAAAPKMQPSDADRLPHRVNVTAAAQQVIEGTRLSPGFQVKGKVIPLLS